MQTHLALFFIIKKCAYLWQKRYRKNEYVETVLTKPNRESEPILEAANKAADEGLRKLLSENPTVAERAAQEAAEEGESNL